jgi:predicted transcriptional regulator
MEYTKMNREISGCESLIMKIIWDAEEDLPLRQLKDKLQTGFGKEYARTTVATFLARLSEKGFVQTYRIGRVAYVRPLKSKEEYIRSYFADAVDFWLDGDYDRLAELLDGTCRLTSNID